MSASASATHLPLQTDANASLRRRGRGLTKALLSLLALDTAVAFVSGHSLLGGAVASAGFAWRAGGAALLLLLLAYPLARPAGWLRGGRLALVLLLLPSFVHFEAAGGRLSGVDAISYYVFLRSMVKDRDFDLANEYEHYGMLSRRDLAAPTRTGHRRSIYSVGPAVVWTPFFLAGEALGRLDRLLGRRDVDLSGYGPYHVNAVALGNFLYGFLALLLIHALLLRHFREKDALGAVLVVWGATFFYWYLVIQPTYSHSSSTLLAALAVLLWDQQRRGTPSAWPSFFLGTILGLGMCVRWQNGVLLILPGLSLALFALRAPRSLQRALACFGLLLAGTFVGAFPQMACWKALYDMWVLPYPPQGTDFLRLGHPWVLETFFSSRHGLLSWTPALWAGFLGFVPLARRRPSLAWPLLAPLLVMTYVNLCVGDWWGGTSFSNRRFDSLLPILAVGCAASLDRLRALFRGRPALVLALGALPFVLWNATLAEQLRRGLLPRDDSVTFARLAGNAARLVSDAVGFPTTWPASWIFAWREGRPPGQYDLLVGRYLFYRQNSLNGHIELAAPEHEALLGEGFGAVETWDGVRARRVLGSARVFAPLDVPQTIDLRIRATASQETVPVRVRVNGLEAGAFLPGRAWGEYHVRATAAFWRRELNDVVLDAGSAEVLVSDVFFDWERSR